MAMVLRTVCIYIFLYLLKELFSFLPGCSIKDDDQDVVFQLQEMLTLQPGQVALGELR